MSFLLRGLIIGSMWPVGTSKLAGTPAICGRIRPSAVSTRMAPQSLDAHPRRHKLGLDRLSDAEIEQEVSNARQERAGRG